MENSEKNKDSTASHRTVSSTLIIIGVLMVILAIPSCFVVRSTFPVEHYRRYTPAGGRTHRGTVFVENRTRRPGWSAKPFFAIILLGGTLAFIGDRIQENAKEERQEIRREQAKRRREEEEKEAKELDKKERLELLAKYGDITKEIRVLAGEGYEVSIVCNTIVIFEQKSTILIQGKPYRFEEIVNYEVDGNSVVLTLNNLSEPTLNVSFAGGQNGIQEFVSILSIILQRQK
ncbi:MAG: hypothetical protein FWB84_07665 [Candidatus Bathyarchaeota archaeon]|uniref:hypothetical protein n=1 Tax=Candidatus Bathycorpusculum sp. TaxID=2994959 RepID=UPI0028275105|nr:hypothetical protein [Candidatus Termiticorpusculum sp.]